MPSVFAALDVTLRRLGGAPTYVLTDNEKTVTTEHVAGIAVRNPQMVAFARHYAVTIHTCEPADPATKGGSESTVKLAKADLVPKDTNLLPAYDSFAELETACEVFCELVNTRVHRVTRRAPVEMLAEEQARLHPVPAHPHMVAFGLTRTVPPSMPMVAFEGGRHRVGDQPPCASRRAAGTAAESLRHDHRRGLPRADREQGVQAPDAGVAVTRSLFGVAVDLDDGVVDVDQDLTVGLVDPGHQRRLVTESGQET
jgi:hypothetical protein